MPLKFLLQGGEFLERLWNVQSTKHSTSSKLALLYTTTCVVCHIRDSMEPDRIQYVSSTLVDDEDISEEWSGIVEGDSNFTNPGRLFAS